MLAADLFLYLELLILLVGTLLYGYLLRELLRRTEVVPGNRSLRLLVACLALWYGGGLLDELVDILIGSSRIGFAATLIDVVRGGAWLLVFPLFAQAMRGLLPHQARPPWWVLVPPYVTLLPFWPALVDTVVRRSTALEVVARTVVVPFALHVAVGGAVAIWMLVRIIGLTTAPTVARLQRWLLGSLVLTVGLNLIGAVAGTIGPTISWGGAVWRVLTLGSGLAVGVTFLYLVHRYNVLQLSLSHRSLRHSLAVAGLVLIVMLTGPAVGAEGSHVARRFVAWGVLIGLAYAGFGRRLGDWLAARYRPVRRLLGRAMAPAELDRIVEQIQGLDVPERELLARTAAAIGEWLDADLRVIDDRVEGGSADGTLFDRFAADPAAGDLNRLDAAARPLLPELAVAGLHAVFPVRVGPDLVALLGVDATSGGGGYRDGEMASVRVVLRQLTAVLKLRRLYQGRMEDERRLAERERLAQLGMVAASLAHEIKNPLSAMKALTQAVAEELSAAAALDEAALDEAARDVELIGGQIERLHGVTRDILGFARPPGDDAADLRALTLSAAVVLGHEGARIGVVLDTAGIGPVGRVPGTSGAWQTILFNLILNAVQHAPRGSQVDLRLFQERGRVLFETRNGGPAIPATLVAQLWQPFTTTTGTGLGLALVQRRVDALGGTLHLDNRDDQIVFRVEVPLAVEGHAAPDSPSSEGEVQ